MIQIEAAKMIKMSDRDIIAAPAIKIVPLSALLSFFAVIFAHFFPLSFAVCFLADEVKRYYNNV